MVGALLGRLRAHEDGAWKQVARHKEVARAAAQDPSEYTGCVCGRPRVGRLKPHKEAARACVSVRASWTGEPRRAPYAVWEAARVHQMLNLLSATSSNLIPLTFSSFSFIFLSLFSPFNHSPLNLYQDGALNDFGGLG